MVTTRRRAYEQGDSVPKRRKTDNESASISVSRACRICLTEVPRCLAVLNPCGHAFCHACSLKLRFDVPADESFVSCSVCRRDGEFVALKEELIGESADPRQEREREADRVLADEVNALAALRAVVAQAKNMINVLNLTSELSNILREESDTAEMAKLARARPEYITDATREFTSMSEQEFAAYLANLEDKVRRADIERSRATELSRTVAETMEEIEQQYDGKKARVMQLIDQFKQENEECATRGLRYTRACRACSTESPPLRSFFPACGHAVCRECADKDEASDADKSCPVCRVNGGSIPFFEELADS